MDNILHCPACGHGAAVHGNGICSAPINGGCSCGKSPAAIVELVLAEDRRERDRDLDRYLVGVKRRYEQARTDS